MPNKKRHIAKYGTFLKIQRCHKRRTKIGERSQMSQNESETEVRNPFKIIVYAISFIILLVIAIKLNNYEDAEQKHKLILLQESKELICQSGPGGIAFVLVSKKSGYSLYKDKYFKKGNELINIKYCKRVEEQ